MMKKLALVAILLLTASCASQKMPGKKLVQANKDYNASLQHNKVSCQNAAACRTAFELTQGYIKTNSDMPIRKVDGTTISTDKPVNPLEIGMSAIKTPGAGQSATITIQIQCAGLSGELDKPNAEKSWKVLCLQRVIPIYNGYERYVNQHISE